MTDDLKDKVSAVAFLYAMEIGGNPKALAEYAIRVASVDPRSLDAMQIYQGWRKVWIDIHGEDHEDSNRVRFYNEEMTEIHSTLVKRLHKKGLINGSRR